MTTLADKAKTAVEDLARAYLDTLDKLEKAEKTMRFAADRIKTMLKAVDEMEAERDGLREALQVYADPCDAAEGVPCGYEGNMCCKTARAALKQEGEG